MKSLLFFTLWFLLNGCSEPAHSLPYPVTISEEGVGAIHPHQPYDFNTLQAALPGFEFIRLQPVSSEPVESIVLLKRGSLNLAQIFIQPDQKKIREISILSPHIKNRDDKGIGDTLIQHTSLECKRNLCHYSDEPSVIYKVDLPTHRILEISYRKL